MGNQPSTTLSRASGGRTPPSFGIRGSGSQNWRAPICTSARVVSQHPVRESNPHLRIESPPSSPLDQRGVSCLVVRASRRAEWAGRRSNPRLLGFNQALCRLSYQPKFVSDWPLRPLIRGAQEPKPFQKKWPGVCLTPGHWVSSIWGSSKSPAECHKRLCSQAGAYAGLSLAPRANGKPAVFAASDERMRLSRNMIPSPERGCCTSTLPAEFAAGRVSVTIDVGLRSRFT